MADRERDRGRDRDRGKGGGDRGRDRDRGKDGGAGRSWDRGGGGGQRGGRDQDRGRQRDYGGYRGGDRDQGHRSAGDAGRRSGRFERGSERPFERDSERPFERRSDRPFEPRRRAPYEGRPDRPFRRPPFGGSRATERDGDAAGGERPPRELDGDRAPRELGAGRPRAPEPGDRPRRPEGRPFDRPRRDFDRPRRDFDRPRRDFDRPPRPDDGGRDRPRPPMPRAAAPRPAARVASGAEVDVAELLGEGEEVVAGRRPVSEAFAARRDARRLLVVPDRRAALESLVLHATTLRLPVVEVEGGTLTSLTGFDGHQGIALVVARRAPATVEEMLARAARQNEAPLLLVLDSLEDPQNLGTLLRSAEACGGDGVIYPRRPPAPLTPAAIKSSAGASEHLLLASVDNLPGTLADLRAAGLRLVGAEEGAPLRYAEADLRGPLALVVGSEERGISGALRRRLDMTVRIPMRGRVGSLNAAVAGSVLLFAAAEQRGTPEMQAMPMAELGEGRSEKRAAEPTDRSAEPTDQAPTESPDAGAASPAEAAAEPPGEPAAEPPAKSAEARPAPPAEPDDPAPEPAAGATAEPADEPAHDQAAQAADDDELLPGGPPVEG